MSFGDGIAAAASTTVASAAAAAPWGATPAANVPADAGIDVAAQIRAGITQYVERGAAGEFDDPGLAAVLELRSRDTNAFAVASVLEMGVSQAEGRIHRLDATLRSEFPLAGTMPSASTGWDVEAFVPATPAEAEAFAQRIVVDAVQASAQLELLVARRERAAGRARSGDDLAAREVGELDRLVDSQLSFVDRLTRVVDASSGGTLTDSGAVAISEARTDPELAAMSDGITAAIGAVFARASARGARPFAGASAEQVRERVVGAAAQARRVAKDPDRGAAEVTGMARDVARFTFDHRSDLRAARRAAATRIEERRARERADEDARAARERIEERHVRWLREREQVRERRELEQRVEEERLEFRGHLLRVEQRTAQRWSEHLREIDRKRGIPTSNGPSVGERIIELAIERTAP